MDLELYLQLRDEKYIYVYDLFEAFLICQNTVKKSVYPIEVFYFIKKSNGAFSNLSVYLKDNANNYNNFS